ncbi:putative toxin-antitoxin system toxin component, PIN family [candidate division KSB1 bacterium]|nr:putative toxin-antitoxin system toxin component, PIN family [candidate division KSB1 bacterium]
MKVVIDTNILVSGLGNPRGAPAKLIDRWLHGQFDLIASNPIFAEYTKILLHHPHVPNEKAGNFLDSLITLSEFVQISENLIACKDPGDNVFLETAVVGNAEYLVTKNFKHFPVKQYQNVRIVRVSQLLSVLEKIFH